METHDPGTKPYWMAVRLALFYMAFFAVLGIQLPFWQLWLSSRGLGPEEISIVLSLATLLRPMVSPLFARWSDHIGERKRPMIALSVFAAFSFTLFYLTNNFWTIAAVTVLFTMGWAPIMPLGEVVVATAARDYNLQYGRVRLWGSLSFIAAAASAGLVLDGYTVDAALWLVAGATVATAASCFLLPDQRTTQETAQHSAFRSLLLDRKFVLLLVSAGLLQSSHGMYYTLGSVHWSSVGYSMGIIGWLWAEGVLAEVVLFAFGATVAQRFSPSMLILLGGLAGVLRWTVTGMTDALPALIVVQLLHAFTFGAVHLGAIYYVMRNVPSSLSATAMSLYSSLTIGLATSATIYVSGPLYESFGSAAYLAMTGLSASGTAVAIWLARYDKADD